MRRATSTRKILVDVAANISQSSPCAWQKIPDAFPRQFPGHLGLPYTSCEALVCTLDITAAAADGIHFSLGGTTIFITRELRRGGTKPAFRGNNELRAKQRCLVRQKNYERVPRPRREIYFVFHADNLVRCL